MKKTVYTFWLIIVSSFFLNSCAVDEQVEDVRDYYVGTWSFDDSLAKKLEISTVEVSKAADSEDEIYISNFHNLGMAVKAKFRVSERYLVMTSTTLDGLSASGSGNANYNYDEVVFEYEVDNESFTATMSR